jgi:hypothetical protein
MEAAVENKNRYIAMALTLVFHALLILLFILIVFITPIPPFEIKPVPEVIIGLGTEGLGNSDAGGSGQHDNDIATTSEKVKSEKADNSANNIVTDETETAVVIKKNPKSKKENKSETPVEVEQKASSELQAALAILKNKKRHTGKGEGDKGTGGSGDGGNNGVGDGNGTGHGNGVFGYNGKGGYDLKGRQLIVKPDNLTDSDEEGIVVVEIIVDANGKVIKATPGQRGSTTTSAKLFGKARQAVMQVKFNPSPDGTKEQRGTWTFVFTLD